MFYSLKTKGIIIKRRRYGEADRILTVFCEDLGKIEVMARGVRKTRGKLKGHLELFTLVKLELIRGKARDIIIGAESLNYFKKLKADLDKVVLAHFLAEFVDKYLPERVADYKFYTIFRHLFLDLDKFSGKKEYLKKVVLGEWQILAHLGILPRFDQCLGCGGALSRGPLELGEGGVYCGRCAKGRGFLVEKEILVGVVGGFGEVREVRGVGEVGGEDLEKVSLALAHFLAMALAEKAKALGWLGRLG